MRSFYLIGNPLSHSFSAAYFLEKFKNKNIQDAVYNNFQITDISKIRAWALNQQHLVGFNVTIPYKETILPFLDQIDPTARLAGAVNTVIVQNRKLIGYNTDVIGFQSTLPALPNPNKTALILGTGGASKAVALVFKQAGVAVLFVSRERRNSNTIGYADITLSLMQSVEYIVNTTPLGTSPNEDTAPPFPFELLSSEHICYDLVYNPAETLFMRQAKQNGARVCNGLKMLQSQAEAAWQIWNN
jgi:shikimate dehydrogenase